MAGLDPKELRAALFAELERGEDASLSLILAELGLIEDPPGSADAKILASARAGRSLFDELGRGEDADLFSSVRALDLEEHPSHELDLEIRSRAEDAAEERHASPRRAAAGGLVWFQDLFRDSAFGFASVAAVGTALLVIALAPRGGPRSESGVGIHSEVTQRTLHLAPPSAADLFVATLPVETSTVERSLAEALAGAGGIRGLAADGTLLVEPSLDGAKARAPRLERLEGPLSKDTQSALLVVLGDRLAELSACSVERPQMVFLELSPEGRAQVMSPRDPCLAAWLAGVAIPKTDAARPVRVTAHLRWPEPHPRATVR